MTKSNYELDMVLSLGFIYVLSEQMGMSQKPSGVAGKLGREVIPSTSPPSYNAWSRQVGAMGQQLSQESCHCKAVGRKEGAVSLLPEL